MLQGKDVKNQNVSSKLRSVTVPSLGKGGVLKLLWLLILRKNMYGLVGPKPLAILSSQGYKSRINLHLFWPVNQNEDGRSTWMICCVL